MILYIYIAPGARADNPLGQNFDVNRKALSLCPFVASFKQNTLNSDFIHIFLMLLYMYIAPGQEQTTPWGHNVVINVLSLWSFL